MATPAQAAFLASFSFDSSAVGAPGVTGGFSGVTGFETAAAGPWNAGGWSGNYIANRSFGNPASSTKLTLNNIPGHTAIDANFVLGFLESWDSINGTVIPDFLDLLIDGNLVAQLTANNASGTVENFGGGTILAHYVQANGNGYFTDTLVDMSTASFLNFAHTASTLTLEIRASGFGWQGGSDEAWGIDNVALAYTPSVPEPASWALMIAGFGLTGAAMRRREKVRVTYA
jgi:PEP-CTERM motif